MNRYDQPPSPIPVYARIEEQYWRRPHTQAHRDHVYYEHDRCPPFLIVRDSAPGNDMHVVLRGENGSTYLLNTTVNMTTVDGKDYAWPDIDVLGSSQVIPAGRYYMRIQDSAGTIYFSEWFNITDCYTDKVMLRWTDNCSIMGIPYALMTFPPVFPDNRLRNFTWRMMIRTELTDPEVNTEHDEVDNGEGKQRITSTTSVRYLLDELLTPYQIEAVHGITHHRNNQVREHIVPDDTFPADVTFVDHAITVQEVSSEVVGNGCQQKTLIRLKLRDDRKTACCDGSALTSAQCYPWDTARFNIYLCTDHAQYDDVVVSFGDPPGTTAMIRTGDEEGLEETWDGASYLPFTPPAGTWVHIQYDVEASAMGESGFTVDGDFAIAQQEIWVIMQVAGSLSGVTPALANNPLLVADIGDPGFVLLYIDAPVPEVAALNRFVQLFWSKTQNGAYTPVDDGLLTEQGLFEDGFNVPADGKWYRAHYYTHTCDYGWSRAASSLPVI